MLQFMFLKIRGIKIKFVTFSASKNCSFVLGFVLNNQKNYMVKMNLLMLFKI